MKYTIVFAVACALMCLAEARPGRTEHQPEVYKTCEERFADCTSACAALPDTCAECDSKKAACDQKQACIAIKSVCIACNTDTACVPDIQQQCDACKALHGRGGNSRGGDSRGGNWKSPGQDHQRWGNKTCEERFTDCTTACAALPDTCAECDSKKAACDQKQACIAIKSVCIACNTGTACVPDIQQQCEACKALHSDRNSRGGNSRGGDSRGGNWKSAGQDHQRWGNKTCEERFTECTTACAALPDTCAECDSKKAACDQKQACIAIKSVCISCNTSTTCEAAQQQQCDACKALRAGHGNKRGGAGKGSRKGSNGKGKH